MTLRRGWLLVALGCCVILAGCAERQTREQYQRKVTEAYTTRSQVIHEIGSRQTDDVAYYEEAGRTISALADDMDTIAPPRDVQQAHDRYVSSLRGMAKILGVLAECAKLDRTDPDKANACRRDRLPQGLLDDTENDFQEAETIYRHQGYKLPQVSTTEEQDQ